MGRVALIGENSTEYVDTLLDIWNNGDCAVLLDWRIPLKTAIVMMKEADVYKCFIEKKYFNINNVDAPTNIEFVLFERKNNNAEYLDNNIYYKFIEKYSQDEAVVIYSSGTTGKSKGIILSHFAINTNADSIIDYMCPTDNDCIYLAKTLSHLSTLTGELLVSLKSKTKLVIAPTIVPPRYVLNKIEQFGVSVICLNPTLLSMLANEYQSGKYNLSSLKTIYVSGSVLNDKVFDLAHKVFKNQNIYNIYGLSEAGPRVTAQRKECCNSNSVGRPIKGIELSIIDETGNRVLHGERGIIHIKTPSRFTRYVSGEEKHMPLCEGWLNTGDIGYFDDFDELHIINRIDDVIIINSHKVYPGDVEKKILTHTSISECAVVAVEYKGTELLGCVYVGTQDVDINIRKQLNDLLMAYEIPRLFIKRSAIPRTRNGKISKQEIQVQIIMALKEGKI